MPSACGRTVVVVASRWTVTKGRCSSSSCCSWLLWWCLVVNILFSNNTATTLAMPTTLAGGRALTTDGDGDMAMLTKAVEEHSIELFKSALRPKSSAQSQTHQVNMDASLEGVAAVVKPVNEMITTLQESGSNVDTLRASNFLKSLAETSSDDSLNLAWTIAAWGFKSLGDADKNFVAVTKSLKGHKESLVKMNADIYTLNNRISRDKHLQAVIDEDTRRATEVDLKFRATTKEVDKVKADLQKATNESKNLQDEKTKLQQNLDQKTNEVNKHKADLQTAKDESKTLQDEKTQLQQDVDQKTNEVNKHKADLQTAKDESKTLQANLTDLEDEKKAEVDKHKADMKTAKNESKILQDEKTKLQENLDQKTNDVAVMVEAMNTATEKWEGRVVKHAGARICLPCPAQYNCPPAAMECLLFAYQQTTPLW
eukprot:GHVS01071318.1.p1 GENE.GHVS01071318.1~~GHVS01071318.1.p1  ORF type:complete len:427 (+),score=73.03 GHVS01071318.1:574-1854(+)